MRTITAIISLAFIFGGLYVLRDKINGLNAQKNDIDLLQEILPALTKYLPHKKEVIFNSSCTDGRQFVLYYQSQFIMAPQVILKNVQAQRGDTVLIVEKECTMDSVQLHSFNELTSVNNGELKVKICVKQ
jgi:hypothetical protein